jgi:hypothetical protein
LEETVRSSTQQLPELKAAGVVDAGALGMFLFFDSCFHALMGKEDELTVVTETLKGSFALSDSWEGKVDQGYCLDVVLQMGNKGGPDMGGIKGLGKSAVIIPDGEFVKVHLHAADQEEARERLESMGNVVRWSADELETQTRRFTGKPHRQALHIMTDAAGSITREDAVDLGITLLDSYITLGRTCLPESYLDPAELYAAMRRGVKASTSQASVIERHQCYEKVLGLHPKVLYVCVGSFYTGNYEVAREWKSRNDPDNRLILLDSGVASGRLGLAVMAAARFSASTAHGEAVVRFAEQAVERCGEILFLDKLKWLVAGGRMSRPGAFIGDMLHLKPVVTPTPNGAKKMAVVRSSEEQVRFAIRHLEAALPGDGGVGILLEYSDNKEWVVHEVRPLLERRFPFAEIRLQQVSLTSGVHMGPGTWGVAFLPLDPEEKITPIWP